MAQIAGSRPVEAHLTVGEVARASGVATSAVRFYQEHGVVTAVRTPANQRRFDESAACRIKVAKVAQRIGLTVREIADIFAELPPDAEPEDWQRVAQILIVEAEERVRRLSAELDAIGSGRKLCALESTDLSGADRAVG